MAMWTAPPYWVVNYYDVPEGQFDSIATAVLELGVGLAVSSCSKPVLAAYLAQTPAGVATSAPNYAYSRADTDQNGDVASADALAYLKYSTDTPSVTQAQIDIMLPAIDGIFALWQANGIGYFGDTVENPLFAERRFGFEIRGPAPDNKIFLEMTDVVIKFVDQVTGSLANGVTSQDFTVSSYAQTTDRCFPLHEVNEADTAFTASIVDVSGTKKLRVVRSGNYSANLAYFNFLVVANQ